MTEVEAAKLLAVLVTAFPDGLRFMDERQQEETRKLYRRCLLDLPYPAGNAAIAGIIATHKRWPAISEIRAASVSHAEGRLMLSGEAWGEVRKLRQPQERSLDELEPTLRACIVAMGWVTRDLVFRGGAEIPRWYVVIGENEAADRARFVQMYDQLAHRSTQDRALGALAPPIRTRAALASGETVGAVIERLMPPSKDPDDH